MTNEKCNTTFLLKIESLFGAYLALKGNLWINSGLKKSLSIRDQFELKFIRLKYPNKKSPHKIQTIRKFFVNNIKKSKQFYFKKTKWKEIKKIIS